MPRQKRMLEKYIRHYIFHLNPNQIPKIIKYFPVKLAKSPELN